MNEKKTKLPTKMLRGEEVPIVPFLHEAMEEVTRESKTFRMARWHSINGDEFGRFLDVAPGEECGMAHCRGGWAVLLAGAQGAALERGIGTESAARSIYEASTNYMPSFFCDDAAARADIVRCAELARKGKKAGE